MASGFTEKLMARARLVRETGGFSILSVLIAIVLMGVGVAAVSSTTVYLLSLRTEAAQRSAATALAVAYMEDVKTRPAQSVVSKAMEKVDEIGTLNASGDYTRNLVVSPGPIVNSKIVQVEVTYPTGLGRRGKIELVTIIYSGL